MALSVGKQIYKINKEWNCKSSCILNVQLIAFYLCNKMQSRCSDNENKYLISFVDHFVALSQIIDVCVCMQNGNRQCCGRLERFDCSLSIKRSSTVKIILDRSNGMSLFVYSSLIRKIKCIRIAVLIMFISRAKIQISEDYKHK